jgi:hypothetical protein
MKITICGSVKFANKLVDVFYQLEKLGHKPIMHEDMFGIADGTAKELIDEIRFDHSEVKKKHNFIKLWHGFIVSSDAILVCNFSSSFPISLSNFFLLKLIFAILQFLNTRRGYNNHPIARFIFIFFNILYIIILFPFV